MQPIFASPQGLVVQHHAPATRSKKFLEKSSVLKPDSIFAYYPEHAVKKFLKIRTALRHTVVRNYAMNQNFADVNPERDFQPFDDEKNSHLQTKIS